MRSSAKTQQPAVSRWHNHLPEWIVNDPAYCGSEDPPVKGLRQQYRQTLQAIANRCDVHKDGLLGAFGGKRLIESTGVWPSTFWLHVKRLEKLGFLVTLTRGGTLGGKNYGNQYGVPATRGSLDHMRCQREVRVMIADGAGKMRPEVVTPGSQMQLWRDTGVRNSDGGRPKLGRGSSETRTPPYPYESPSVFPAGGVSNETIPEIECERRAHSSKRRRRRSVPARLGRVSSDDLSSPRRLLHLYERACAMGLCDRSDHGRLQFAAAAVHAKRIGVNPPALFATIVNRGMWLMISQADESKANTWIKPVLYGD